MNPGTRVQTTDGPGTIIGKDLPGGRAMRYKVRLDDMQEALDKGHTIEPDFFCYWPHEIKTIKK